MVKHLSAMQETRVQSLGWEDPLEKEMAAHSSTLAWIIPWTEDPGRLQSIGSQRVRRDFTFTFSAVLSHHITPLIVVFSIFLFILGSLCPS